MSFGFRDETFGSVSSLTLSTLLSEVNGPHITKAVVGAGVDQYCQSIVVACSSGHIRITYEQLVFFHVHARPQGITALAT